MRNLMQKLAVAFMLTSMPVLAWADSASDIKALQDTKALLDAQAAKDNSEAAAIKAGSDLAKAKAATADVANDIQKSQLDAAAGLIKSQIGAQTAQTDALRASFGAAPTIGSDGNIQITDATSGVLLQIKAGSLGLTWELADKLCTTLEAANIKAAYIAPSDLDSKIQSARMVLREYNALLAKVRDESNKALVEVPGIQPQVAPAAILGAVSLLQYGAGALQTIGKLFRADYAVGLSSDASRVAWLEYFMAAKCPCQIPQAQLEAVERNKSIESAINGLNEMLEFYNKATSKKNAIQKQIDLLTKRIADLRTANPKADTSKAEDSLKNEMDNMVAIAPLDVWLPRIQALITSVSTTPGAFLDALTWRAFGEGEIANRPRLTVLLTTQDGQITETFWLTGKKVYGRSAGELIYRVTEPSGKVAAVGYFTATSSSGKIDFDSKEVTVISGNTHDVPLEKTKGSGTGKGQ